MGHPICEAYDNDNWEKLDCDDSNGISSLDETCPAKASSLSAFISFSVQKKSDFVREVASLSWLLDGNETQIRFSKAFLNYFQVKLCIIFQS